MEIPAKTATDSTITWATMPESSIGRAAPVRAALHPPILSPPRATTKTNTIGKAAAEVMAKQRITISRSSALSVLRDFPRARQI